jgi:putative cell wall-binding protein
VPVVFIATGTAFADALAGGPAADKLGGPILPIAPGGIPAPIRSELTRLQPGRIVILGGPGAVSQAIATELDSFTTGTVKSGAVCGPSAATVLNRATPH